MTGPRATTALRTRAAAAATEEHLSTESQPGTDRVQRRPLSETRYKRRKTERKQRFYRGTKANEGLFKRQVLYYTIEVIYREVR